MSHSSRLLPDHQRPVHSSTPPNHQRVATVLGCGRSRQKELEAYLRLEFQVSSFFFIFYCSTNVFLQLDYLYENSEGEDGCRHQQRWHLRRHGHQQHHQHHPRHHCRHHHRHQRGLETCCVSSPRYCKFFLYHFKLQVTFEHAWQPYDHHDHQYHEHEHDDHHHHQY